MPEQTRKSNLLAKLGNRFKQAAENHVNDVFKPRGTLPGSVRGIAHLNSIKIGEYENGPHKGEPFFMAQAAVVYPEEYVGSTTKIGPEPLCDTPEMKGKWEGAPTTLDDHVGIVFRYLHMLGGDGCTESVKDSDDFDAAMQDLFDTLLDPENPIYISFETTQKLPDKTGAKAGVPKPVNHYWNKRVEWTPTDEAAKHTNDESATPAAKPSTNGAGKKTTSTNKLTGATNKTATAAPAAKRGPGRPKKQVVEEIAGDTPTGAVDETASSEEDLDALAELADGEDEESKLRLAEIAEPLGITKVQIKKLDNWVQVVELIREKQAEASGDEPTATEGSVEEPAEETAEEPAEEPSISKGDVVGYKPTVQGVKSKKVINHEVMSVNLERGIVTLKNLINNQVLKTSDGKNVLAVKIADLLPQV